jgi:branched-chain amino acid transport system substrate-binding protein
LGVAACGHDDDDSASTTAAGGAATTAAGGGSATTAAAGGGTATTAAAAPTGTPVKVGFINIDSGAVSFPESTAGAKAAEGVINDTLGGIGGHPLQVVYCSVNGTPESSQTCAAKMVDEKVVAVTLGLDFNDSVLVPVFENAKIPIIGGVPAGQDILASKSAFFFQAGLPAVYPGIPYWISQNLKDVKKVAILHADDPTSKFIAETNMKPYFEQLGMTAQLFQESGAAADYTPVVSAAIATNPDLITSTFGNVACIGYMKALKSLAYKGKVFHSAGCYDKATFDAVGLDNLEGQYFDFGLYGFYSKDALPADKQPELQIFSDAMAKYSPDTPLAGFPEASFQQLMNIKAIFEEIGVDKLSFDSIIALMTDKKVRKSFLAPDWSCDGTAAIAAGVFVQSVCTTEVLTYQVQSGKIVQVGEPFNGNYLIQQAKK